MLGSVVLVACGGARESTAVAPEELAEEGARLDTDAGFLQACGGPMTALTAADLLVNRSTYTAKDGALRTRVMSLVLREESRKCLESTGTCGAWTKVRDSAMVSGFGGPSFAVGSDAAGLHVALTHTDGWQSGGCREDTRCSNLGGESFECMPFNRAGVKAVYLSNGTYYGMACTSSVQPDLIFKGRVTDERCLSLEATTATSTPNGIRMETRYSYSSNRPF
ncbi:MAG: hypothetical protein ACT4TC_11970 [Myxococcaceae bacterium]